MKAIANIIIPEEVIDPQAEWLRSPGLCFIPDKKNPLHGNFHHFPTKYEMLWFLQDKGLLSKSDQIRHLKIPKDKALNPWEKIK